MPYFPPTEDKRIAEEAKYVTDEINRLISDAALRGCLTFSSSAP